MADMRINGGYEDCIVSFLDILGFRHMLETTTADRIAHMLNRFRGFSRPAPIEPVRRSDEMRLTSEAGAEIVSDAVVRYRTTETQYGNGALFLELLNLLHIQIECIAEGTLIRGAVTFGPMHVGINFDGPIFGMALTEAYLMESKQVIYPRIVVNEEIIANLDNTPSLRRDEHTIEEDLEYLRSILTTDESGMIFIDYLRGSLSEMDEGYSGWLEFLDRHKQLIENGLSTQITPKNRRKYIWLASYHNRTIHNEMENIDLPEFIEESGTSMRDLLSGLLIDITIL